MNQAIRTLANVDIEGDVLVVAIGEKYNVNLRGGDEARAAERVVERYVIFISVLASRILILK